jgi:predicted ATP-dependent serine protease
MEPHLRTAKAALVDRAAECARLDQLQAEARSGHSAVLVLRGDPGIGKSALLEYAADRAEECRVLHAIGAEWEMELPLPAFRHRRTSWCLNPRETNANCALLLVAS